MRVVTVLLKCVCVFASVISTVRGETHVGEPTSVRSQGSDYSDDEGSDGSRDVGYLLFPNAQEGVPSSHIASSEFTRSEGTMKYGQSRYTPSTWEDVPDDSDVLVSSRTTDHSDEVSSTSDDIFSSWDGDTFSTSGDDGSTASDGVPLSGDASSAVDGGDGGSTTTSALLGDSATEEDNSSASDGDTDAEGSTCEPTTGIRDTPSSADEETNSEESEVNKSPVNRVPQHKGYRRWGNKGMRKKPPGPITGPQSTLKINTGIHNSEISRHGDATESSTKDSLTVLSSLLSMSTESELSTQRFTMNSSTPRPSNFYLSSFRHYTAMAVQEPPAFVDTGRKQFLEWPWKQHLDSPTTANLLWTKALRKNDDNNIRKVTEEITERTGRMIQTQVDRAVKKNEQTEYVMAEESDENLKGNNTSEEVTVVNLIPFDRIEKKSAKILDSKCKKPCKQHCPALKRSTRKINRKVKLKDESMEFKQQPHILDSSTDLSRESAEVDVMVDRFQVHAILHPQGNETDNTNLSAPSTSKGKRQFWIHPTPYTPPSEILSSFSDRRKLANPLPQASSTFSTGKYAFQHPYESSETSIRYTHSHLPPEITFSARSPNLDLLGIIEIESLESTTLSTVLESDPVTIFHESTTLVPTTEDPTTSTMTYTTAFTPENESTAQSTSQMNIIASFAFYNPFITATNDKIIDPTEHAERTDDENQELPLLRSFTNQNFSPIIQLCQHTKSWQGKLHSSSPSPTIYFAPAPDPSAPTSGISQPTYPPTSFCIAVTWSPTTRPGFLPSSTVLPVNAPALNAWYSPTLCRRTTSCRTTCRPKTCRTTSCCPKTCRTTSCRPKTCRTTCPTTCRPKTCRTTSCRPKTCRTTTCPTTKCRPATCRTTTCKPKTCATTKCRPTTCRTTTCPTTKCRPTTCRRTTCRRTTCRRPTTCRTTCRPRTCRTTCRTTCRPKTCRTTTCRPKTCRTTCPTTRRTCRTTTCPTTKCRPTTCRTTKCRPTTCRTTTYRPTTCRTTKCRPTTSRTTKCRPTTCRTTTCPTTKCRPTTCRTTKCRPTTCRTTTCRPKTCRTTICRPTTCRTTTCRPSTCRTTTCRPTTCRPSTCRTTTCRPTTCRKTTCRPTTCRKTTCRPTTCRKTTCRFTRCHTTFFRGTYTSTCRSNLQAFAYPGISYATNGSNYFSSTYPPVMSSPALKTLDMKSHLQLTALYREGDDNSTHNGSSETRTKGSFTLSTRMHRRTPNLMEVAALKRLHQRLLIPQETRSVTPVSLPFHPVIVHDYSISGGGYASWETTTKSPKDESPSSSVESVDESKTSYEVHTEEHEDSINTQGFHSWEKTENGGTEEPQLIVAHGVGYPNSKNEPRDELLNDSGINTHRYGSREEEADHAKDETQSLIRDVDESSTDFKTHDDALNSNVHDSDSKESTTEENDETMPSTVDKLNALRKHLHSLTNAVSDSVTNDYQYTWQKTSVRLKDETQAFRRRSVDDSNPNFQRLPQQKYVNNVGEKGQVMEYGRSRNCRKGPKGSIICASRSGISGSQNIKRTERIGNSDESRVVGTNYGISKVRESSANKIAADNRFWPLNSYRYQTESKSNEVLKDTEADSHGLSYVGRRGGRNPGGTLAEPIPSSASDGYLNEDTSESGDEYARPVVRNQVPGKSRLAPEEVQDLLSLVDDSESQVSEEPEGPSWGHTRGRKPDPSQERRYRCHQRANGNIVCLDDEVTTAQQNLDSTFGDDPNAKRGRHHRRRHRSDQGSRHHHKRFHGDRRGSVTATPRTWDSAHDTIAVATASSTKDENGVFGTTSSAQPGGPVAAVQKAAKRFVKFLGMDDWESVPLRSIRKEKTNGVSINSVTKRSTFVREMPTKFEEKPDLENYSPGRSQDFPTLGSGDEISRSTPANEFETRNSMSQERKGDISSLMGIVAMITMAMNSPSTPDLKNSVEERTDTIGFPGETVEVTSEGDERDNELIPQKKAPFVTEAESDDDTERQESSTLNSTFPAREKKSTLGSGKFTLTLLNPAVAESDTNLSNQEQTDLGDINERSPESKAFRSKTQFSPLKGIQSEIEDDSIKKLKSFRMDSPITQTDRSPARISEKSFIDGFSSLSQKTTDITTEAGRYEMRFNDWETFSSPMVGEIRAQSISPKLSKITTENSEKVSNTMDFADALTEYEALLDATLRNLMEKERTMTNMKEVSEKTTHSYVRNHTFPLEETISYLFSSNNSADKKEIPSYSSSFPSGKDNDEKQRATLIFQVVKGKGSVLDTSDLRMVALYALKEHSSTLANDLTTHMKLPATVEEPSKYSLSTPKVLRKMSTDSTRNLYYGLIESSDDKYEVGSSSSTSGTNHLRDYADDAMMEKAMKAKSASKSFEKLLEKWREDIKDETPKSLEKSSRYASKPDRSITKTYSDSTDKYLSPKVRKRFTGSELRRKITTPSYWTSKNPDNRRVALKVDDSLEYAFPKSGIEKITTTEGNEIETRKFTSVKKSFGETSKNVQPESFSQVAADLKLVKDTLEQISSIFTTETSFVKREQFAFTSGTNEEEVTPDFTSHLKQTVDSPIGGRREALETTEIDAEPLSVARYNADLLADLETRHETATQRRRVRKKRAALAHDGSQFEVSVGTVDPWVRPSTVFAVPPVVEIRPELEPSLPRPLAQMQKRPFFSPAPVTQLARPPQLSPILENSRADSSRLHHVQDRLAGARYWSQSVEKDDESDDETKTHSRERNPVGAWDSEGGPPSPHISKQYSAGLRRSLRRRPCLHSFAGNRVPSEDFSASETQRRASGVDSPVRGYRKAHHHSDINPTHYNPIGQPARYFTTENRQMKLPFRDHVDISRFWAVEGRGRDEWTRRFANTRYNTKTLVSQDLSSTPYLTADVSQRMILDAEEPDEETVELTAVEPEQDVPSDIARSTNKEVMPLMLPESSDDIIIGERKELDPIDSRNFNGRENKFSKFRPSPNLRRMKDIKGDVSIDEVGAFRNKKRKLCRTSQWITEEDTTLNNVRVIGDSPQITSGFHSSLNNGKFGFIPPRYAESKIQALGPAMFRARFDSSDDTLDSEMGRYETSKYTLPASKKLTSKYELELNRFPDAQDQSYKTTYFDSPDNSETKDRTEKTTNVDSAGIGYSMQKVETEPQNLKICSDKVVYHTCITGALTKDDAIVLDADLPKKERVESLSPKPLEPKRISGQPVIEINGARISLRPAPKQRTSYTNTFTGGRVNKTKLATSEDVEQNLPLHSVTYDIEDIEIHKSSTVGMDTSSKSLDNNNSRSSSVALVFINYDDPHVITSTLSGKDLPIPDMTSSEEPATNASCPSTQSHLTFDDLLSALSSSESNTNTTSSATVSLHTLEDTKVTEPESMKSAPVSSLIISINMSIPLNASMLPTNYEPSVTKSVKLSRFDSMSPAVTPSQTSTTIITPLIIPLKYMSTGGQSTEREIPRNINSIVKNSKKEGKRRKDFIVSFTRGNGEDDLFHTKAFRRHNARATASAGPHFLKDYQVEDDAADHCEEGVLMSTWKIPAEDFAILRDSTDNAVEENRKNHGDTMTRHKIYPSGLYGRRGSHGIHHSGHAYGESLKGKIPRQYSVSEAMVDDSSDEITRYDNLKEEGDSVRQKGNINAAFEATSGHPKYGTLDGDTETIDPAVATEIVSLRSWNQDDEEHADDFSDEEGEVKPEVREKIHAHTAHNFHPSAKKRRLNLISGRRLAPLVAGVAPHHLNLEGLHLAGVAGCGGEKNMEDHQSSTATDKSAPFTSKPPTAPATGLTSKASSITTSQKSSTAKKDSSKTTEAVVITPKTSLHVPSSSQLSILNPTRTTQTRRSQVNIFPILPTSTGMTRARTSSLTRESGKSVTTTHNKSPASTLSQSSFSTTPKHNVGTGSKVSGSVTTERKTRMTHTTQAIPPCCQWTIPPCSGRPATSRRTQVKLFDTSSIPTMQSPIHVTEINAHLTTIGNFSTPLVRTPTLKMTNQWPSGSNVTTTRISTARNFTIPTHPTYATTKPCRTTLGLCSPLLKKVIYWRCPTQKCIPRTKTTKCTTKRTTICRTTTCRTTKPSTCRTTKPTTCRTTKPSTCRTTKPTTCRTTKPSTCRTTKPTTCRTTKPSTCRTTKPTTCRTTKPTTCRTTKLTTCRTTKPSTCRTTKPTTCRTTKPTTCRTTKPTTCRTTKPSTCRTTKPTTCRTTKTTTCRTTKPSTCRTTKPTTCRTTKPTTCRTTKRTTCKTTKPSTCRTTKITTCKTTKPTTTKCTKATKPPKTKKTRCPPMTCNHTSSTCHKLSPTRYNSPSISHQATISLHHRFNSPSTQYNSLSTQYNSPSNQYNSLSTQYNSLSTQYNSPSTRYNSLLTRYELCEMTAGTTETCGQWMNFCFEQAAKPSTETTVVILEIVTVIPDIERYSSMESLRTGTSSLMDKYMACDHTFVRPIPMEKPETATNITGLKGFTLPNIVFAKEEAKSETESRFSVIRLVLDNQTFFTSSPEHSEIMTKSLNNVILEESRTFTTLPSIHGTSNTMSPSTVLYALVPFDHLSLYKSNTTPMIETSTHESSPTQVAQVIMIKSLLKSSELADISLSLITEEITESRTQFTSPILEIENTNTHSTDEQSTVLTENINHVSHIPSTSVSQADSTYIATKIKSEFQTTNEYSTSYVQTKKQNHETQQQLGFVSDELFPASHVEYYSPTGARYSEIPTAIQQMPIRDGTLPISETASGIQILPTVQAMEATPTNYYQYSSISEQDNVQSRPETITVSYSPEIIYQSKIGLETGLPIQTLPSASFMEELVSDQVARHVNDIELLAFQRNPLNAAAPALWQTKNSHRATEKATSGGRMSTSAIPHHSNGSLERVLSNASITSVGTEKTTPGIKSLKPAVFQNSSDTRSVAKADSDMQEFSKKQFETHIKQSTKIYSTKKRTVSKQMRKGPTMTAATKGFVKKVLFTEHAIQKSSFATLARATKTKDCNKTSQKTTEECTLRTTYPTRKTTFTTCSTSACTNRTKCPFTSKCPRNTFTIPTQKCKMKTTCSTTKCYRTTTCRTFSTPCPVPNLLGDKGTALAAACDWSKLVELLDRLDEASAAQMRRTALSQWAYETNMTDATRCAEVEAAVEQARFQKGLVRAAREIMAAIEEKPTSCNTCVGGEDELAAKRARDEESMRRLSAMAFGGTSVLCDSKVRLLEAVISDMEELYGGATVCSYLRRDNCDMRIDPEVARIMSSSPDPSELSYYWRAWHDATGRPMRHLYPVFVRIMNEAAHLNEMPDASALWLAPYEEPRIKHHIKEQWQRVRPLYLELHAHVRRRLRGHFGPETVGPRAPIPAHLLGPPPAQSWGRVTPLTVPFPRRAAPDIALCMRKQNWTPEMMFRQADAFMMSMNLSAAPPSLWLRSMFTQPKNRRVMCHASAWDFFDGTDMRVKACAVPTLEDFTISIHEMGHVQYFMQYAHQPMAFREAANPGFHEAIGDVIALAATGEPHLRRLKLLPHQPSLSCCENNSNSTSSSAANEKKCRGLHERHINMLMTEALERLPLMPVALALERWRWDVFQLSVRPRSYTLHWWRLMEKYAGINPPVPRSEEDFDPGAKYHVAAGAPYIQYFVSGILQFQLFRSLCIKAGQFDPRHPQRKPLHMCDLYGSKIAGERLKAMMRLGSSMPWPEALAEVTCGQERTLNAQGFLDYFAPLFEWLRVENARTGEPLGWDSEYRTKIFSTNKRRRSYKRNEFKKGSKVNKGDDGG